MEEKIIAFVIILVIGGIGIFLVYQKNKGNPKLPIQIIACVFGTFLLLQFGMYATTRQSGRREFKKELKQLDLSKTEIRINGKIADVNIEQVIKELLTVDNLRAHHSSPTNEFKFNITDGNTNIDFELARDSEFSTEYWLDINDRNIGKIRTRLFNDME